MNELAKLLLERLGSAFKSSTGANPSLCITDKDMIKKMNIRHHLTLFTNINGVQDLMKFFATCKLAFQSSVIAGEPNYLRWKDVLKIIREWRISLTDFVGQYVQYKESFVQFPLDASAFVYLMQVRLELEYSRLSSFEVVRDMMTKLKLEYDSFYREYQTLFGQHVQRKVYDESGSCTEYRRLKQPSLVHCFFPALELKTILNKVDTSRYKFPRTTQHILDIMSVQNPADISILENEPVEEFFDHLVEQINVWLDWFEKFVDIFLCIIEWLRNCKMEKADQFYRELYNTRNDSAITLLKIKTLIQDVLKIFEHFNHLPRLCHLFNCTLPFEIIDPGTVSAPDQSKLFIAETKQFRPNDNFKVNANCIDGKIHRIDGRRHVRWSLACEQYPYHVVIEYQPDGSSGEYYALQSQKFSSRDQCLLRGEFKTQRGGHLKMRIENPSQHVPHTLWFQIKSNALSACQLFHGIFNIEYGKCFDSSTATIKKSDFVTIMDRVFSFIDNLLDGSISLDEMNELRVVFCDKNINVREEVQKLFATRSNDDNARLPMTTATLATSKTSSDERIEQVCKWLETYQYYSHVSIIIDCVKIFQIISTEANDQSMNHLHDLTIDNSRSLKEISDTYNDVYLRFKKLSGEHLQLIKTMVACPNVVEMMRNSKLYSTDGLRRFQELRDNLTTQFQFQERNNMILNSWIITFTLCVPFVHNARDLEQFVDDVARLKIIDENSCEHIKGRTQL
ncbi:unnamed protein product [Rotaria magnacalcarata]|uniref:Uncharacterized protein n=1 Tax=Rotaria magnacalcarata TaxID=392030 RepID=A0A8S2KJT5_9BILA|nr:unnamed protein product [Rotaria magnacalcarata]